MKSFKLFCFVGILVLLITAMPVISVGAQAPGTVTVNYGNVSLSSSGVTQSGNFPETWDLTAGDMTISFTYDATGLVDNETAQWQDHAWAELGVRDTTTTSNFNPGGGGGGKGIWLATDYEEFQTLKTFDPDPPDAPSLDLDDKLILQRTGGHGEGDYDLPSTPPAPGNNHRIWWDRDGVDPWQNGETANTAGLYNIVLTFHATSATTGEAYMTINGLGQGFEVDGNWNTIELTPAGMTFGGDMTKMQVFYGIYGYGATHSVNFQNITVTGVQPPIRAYICTTGSDSSQLTPGTSFYQNPPTGSIAYFGQGTENGCLYHDFPAGTTNVKVWTTYNNTTSQQLTQDISTNPTFNFNTNKLTLKLTKCGGAPLSGGTARMKIGSTTYFFPAPNLTDANGITSAEMFPGTYDFEMTYNATTEWKYSQVIPDADHEILWTTTLVSLNWPGQISYGGPAGDSGWFNKPSMEMMPGIVKFHFRPVGSHPGYTTDLTFSGCIYTGGFLTLVDEVGSPLANYPADYPSETRNLKYKYRCGGSWGPEASFKTDAYGMTPYSIGCANWDKKITMTLNQTSKEQDVTVNSTFQAAKINANLKSCTGPITDVPGGTVAQGGGYWYTHGTTGPSGTVSFYTFPANIKLRMSYNHNDLTLYPTIVAGTNEVNFQATKVTFSYAGDIKSNKGGSWWMFSKPTMYLLPGDYNFWFKNGSGWYGPLTFSVSDCELSKGYVLLKVRDENGNGVSGATAKPAYGGSWGAQLPGVTDANGNLFAEIPPGFTKISMTVNQGSQEQSLAQLTSSNYTWKTEILRIWLKDHAGLAITDQLAVLRQGGGYWYTWGNLNASGYRDVQLFPASYKFEMIYNYTAQQLFPIVTAGAGIQNFNFQTGQVISPTITQYSTGAWRTFTSGMELMPGTYTFVSPSQSGTVVAGQVLNLP